MLLLGVHIGSVGCVYMKPVCPLAEATASRLLGYIRHLWPALLTQTICVTVACILAVRSLGQTAAYSVRCLASLEYI